MRSLYTVILLAMLGTLGLSLLAFLAISDHMQQQYFYPVFDAMDELELETARAAWEKGGATATAAYLKRLDQLFGSFHYILNSQGADMISGETRTQLLPGSGSARGRIHGQYVVAHKATDGLYWMVVIDPRPEGRLTFFPYYVLIVAVTGLLCWLAAAFLVAPIRRVTATVDQFGMGDLAVRAQLSRRDEIGDLSRSFDAMAQRIETLLTSERRLLQDISHELRSPLTRLKLAIRLTRTAPDVQGAVDRVEREANRITVLVSEIVEMTRLEGDPLAQTMEPIEIRKLVGNTVDDCRVEAQLFRGCELRISGEVDVTVLGDGELLRRAVENVVRNAIRYSPERTPIDVTIAEVAESINITVRDSGPGVPDEALTQIFQPFFRVEDSRDEQTGGIGLGLSIAQRAVHLHGGTISARNASPGLIVEINIPLRSSRAR
jgi:signal transduction histidine kinase